MYLEGISVASSDILERRSCCKRNLASKVSNSGNKILCSSKTRYSKLKYWKRNHQTETLRSRWVTSS
ncbi:uncharacterized protein PG986_014249 [Apiospora aurea]|uniref:Uncharacterized protein n=1 Tax=Apiospora aurea TaxID=335848 RepID=A0ABR1PSF7_9PEZI